ncbi:MAG: C39 family peptidase [Candidatus Marinimicrobia bacterium]|nr:C39 family peptidase [Candidatus Neomarinimicrobiota bacterium]
MKITNLLRPLEKQCPKLHVLFVVFVLLIASAGYCQTTPYPDQFYTIEGADSLLSGAITVDGIIASADGNSLELASDRNVGYIVLSTQFSASSFNRGLPSWNGTVGDENSGFKIYMRFPYATGWSPWLTVGFWKDNIWSSYGTTSYSGGWIDYDYVKLYSYRSSWQFKIELKRNNLNVASPTIAKLSFLVSDNRTTDQLNYTDILNDNPPPIFIPTTFLYQYSLDPNIGGSICSPTTVCMILESYDISVDPVDFAWDTYDPHYHLFGIWPRVVQNASEYGLDGAVTRYRTWSETYSVLSQGGRIAMSVGQPLYSGHLMMLAGFDSNGNPIVHDPARTYGYSHVYTKYQISHSWFDKGGVGYTFYLRDSLQVSIAQEERINTVIPDELYQLTNYPNPFNAQTTISVILIELEHVSIAVYDIGGRQVKLLYRGYLLPGYQAFIWDGTDNQGNDLSSGVYWAVVSTVNGGRETLPITFLK